MRNRSHRLGLCIAAAATGSLIAVPAASANVVEYDTEQYITKERGGSLVMGGVTSEVRRCEGGRLVVLFKQQRGADRKLGTVRTVFRYGRGDWTVRRSSLKLQPRRHRLYAKVTREVGNGFVCRADRSATMSLKVWH